MIIELIDNVERVPRAQGLLGIFQERPAIFIEKYPEGPGDEVEQLSC